MNEELPEWFLKLGDSLKEHTKRLDRVRKAAGLEPSTLDVDEYDPSPVAPGDIRVARGSGEAAYVVVRDVDTKSHTASVAMITTDVDNAGGTDVILESDPLERTCMGMTILILTDVVGPVYLDQLSHHRVGRLLQEDLDGVLATEWTGRPSVPHAWRGLPLSGPDDRRWAYKLEQRDRMMRISSKAVEAMLRS